MAASANRRKQDDKNLEILRELISISGNKYCLDCNQRGPTYVNTTIGSFVCSKCSGMLRGLTPPHRVKSISMATFTPEELDFIKNRGNDYCKRVWLGLYEGESVNYNDEQSVKDFMSDKYEKKRYYLEPSSNPGITNGNSTSKNKLKTKTSEPSSTTLISIAPQASVNLTNNNVHVGKVLSNISSTKSNEPNHKIARPVNNFSAPLLNNIHAVANSAPAPPVPDFPVDFSTANIYNSTQFISNWNNNSVPQSTTSNSVLFNGFNTSSSTNTTNDRYAALADLDLALRQEKMKNMDENNTYNNVNNKNPFQSTSNSDLFSNKNPFFNGGWSASSTMSTLPVNPFVPSSNNGGFGNSNNPFL